MNHYRTAIISSLLSLTAAVTQPVLGQFGSSAPASPRIAHFHLTGPLLEKPMDEMANLFGGSAPVSLKDLVERFKEARDDDEIKAVVLTIEEAEMGLAQIQELRQALAQVRAADKEVFVHADSLGLGGYVLASAASHLSLVPTGELWMMGLYTETPYLKGLLDKIGVQADFEHIGAYKSAAEPLTREGPSKEAAEMLNWLLDSLYDSMLSMIADSRQLTKEKVKQIMDDGPYLAEEAKKAGLIDAVEYRQDFVKRLRQRYGEEVQFVKNYGADGGADFDLDASNPFVAFGQIMELFSGAGTRKGGTSIGVVYVDGGISTGTEESSPFGGSSGARSTSIAKALDEAADDNSVKAVVLRVDSPGGSALASEIIWNATQRVKAKKPLIVSMGNVAGSGGYYVSCGGDVIFAEPTTITASIGVVGGKLVTTSMWDKVGITWVDNQRGENADMMNSARPFDEDERARIVKYMNDVYVVFKDRIVAGRGKKLSKPLDDIAGGRVYTGEQALQLGLVDKLGGLYDAVSHAAKEAQVGDYEIRVIPAPKTFFDILREGLGGGEEEKHTIQLGTPQLFSAGSPLVDQVLPLIQRLDPQRTRAVLQVLSTLELIHQDGVALTMAPFVMTNGL